jgi:hypothetical protein
LIGKSADCIIVTGGNQMFFLNVGLDKKAERQVIKWVIFFATMPIWGIALLVILATILQ